MRKWIDIPPVWLLAFMILMSALDHYLPIFSVEINAIRYSGYALIAASVLLAILSAMELRRSNTTVLPHEPPSNLATGGPFQFSRNPIYLADVGILAGYWCLLQSLLPVMVIPFFIILLEKRFILIEEKRLKEHFDEAFTSYAGKTRRWI